MAKTEKVTIRGYVSTKFAHRSEKVYSCSVSVKQGEGDWKFVKAIAFKAENSPAYNDLLLCNDKEYVELEGYYRSHKYNDKEYTEFVVTKKNAI